MIVPEKPVVVSCIKGSPRQPSRKWDQRGVPRDPSCGVLPSAGGQRPPDLRPLGSYSTN